MDLGTIIALTALAVTALGGGVAWVLRFGKAESAVDVATRAQAAADAISKELAEFRIEVARDYATTSTLASVERAVTEAFNRLSDRIDRLLELRPAAPPRSRATTKG